METEMAAAVNDGTSQTINWKLRRVNEPKFELNWKGAARTYKIARMV